MTIEPQKVHWWYDAVVDWMIQHPDKTKKDAAEFFNVTTVWMYTLTNSDVFRALYDARRRMHSGLVSSSVIEKTEALADMALDTFLDKFQENEKAGTLTLAFARDTVDMALTKLGYSGRPPNSPVNGGPVINVNVVDRQSLAEARALMFPPSSEARPLVAQTIGDTMIDVTPRKVEVA